MCARLNVVPGAVETGDKNRDESQRHALFWEEILGKIDAKDVEFLRKGSVQEFFRLKALIPLEQENTSVKASMARL